MNGQTWRPGHHRAAAGGSLRGHDEGARDDHRRPPEHSEQRGVPHNRHLSGIYWPGRPMRRERVESDQTYLHTVCDKFGKQLLHLLKSNNDDFGLGLIAYSFWAGLLFFNGFNLADV